MLNRMLPKLTYPDHMLTAGFRAMLNRMLPKQGGKHVYV